MKFQWEKKQHQAKFWKGESLGSIVCIDTETEMIQGPSHIPFLVTFQAYSGEGAVRFVKLADVYSFLQLHADSTLIFHNAPFDLAVLEKECGWDFHTQVTQGKIHDTSILYRLWHLADKGHTPFRWSLDHCVKQMLNLEVEKDEKVRTSFGEFRKGDRVSYEKIPEGAYKYAAIDTICTLLLYRRLMDLILPISGSQLLSHKIQLMGSIALDDIRRNGIGFDLEAQREFRKTLDKKIYNYSNILATWGWVKGQPGNKKRFEQVVEKLGIVDELPRSPKTGEVSSKAEDLEPYTDYQFIDAYIHHQELEKISSFASINSPRVHPKYDLLKNTGRTSCTKPNVQQLPRAAGIRELFIPKPGHCFMIIDYSTLELCTLAQTCYKMYGKSVMRDLINDGVDLHRYYAGMLLNKSPEDVTKQERQYAKAANFGFPGGLGIAKFVQYARVSYGLDNIDENYAKEMKDAWLETFPEMKEYLKGREGQPSSTLTGRIRSNCSYCAGKNTPFQGLAADGAKIALYFLMKQKFSVSAFIHDEVIIEELVSENLTQRFDLASSTMVECMKQVCPDVKISVEGFISNKWYKDGPLLTDEKGGYLVYEGK